MREGIWKMNQKNGKVVKKKKPIKIYAQDHFTEEWREVKMINFEERDFVFKGEHFGNMMDYFNFKVEYVDDETDCEDGSGI
jgi:hypothetical protein